MEYDAVEIERFRARTPKSLQLWQRTKEIVPTGHAGGMGAFVPHPIVLERGAGSRVTDVDGNDYLDLRLGDWVLIHGHSSPAIADAVDAQMRRLVQVGAPEWDLGYRFCKLLVDRTPSLDKVRLFASGTDANLAAIRLARTKTGRTKIAKARGSYHGTADMLIVGNSILRAPDDVVPLGVSPHAIDEVVQYPYNDPDGFETAITAAKDDIAIVLIEPVMTAMAMVEATVEFLQRVREVTTRYGIILLFDEVVTYPMAYGGAQAHFGVTPDLTTFGKAIGGGLPVSAVGGRADVMDLLEADAHEGTAPISIMSTFGGNSAVAAAGIAALEALTPQAHERLSALGDRCRAGIDELGRRYGVDLHATGAGHLIGVHWAPDRVVDYETRLKDDREKVLNINLVLCNEGIYQTFTGLFLLSTAITDADVDFFLQTLDKALHRLGYVD